MRPPNSIFREIQFGSDAYSRACELRQTVLRTPLGLNLGDEDLSAEAEQMHFGLFQGDDLQAYVIVASVSKTEVKLRQMAVSSAVQGKGLGRKLVEQVEAELIRRGFVTAWLHARIAAEAFYVRLGYQRTGDEFVEVGIPHVKMWKRLGE